MFVTGNPVKGLQYSLRDERRDRVSGRIWRIMPQTGEFPLEDSKRQLETIRYIKKERISLSLLGKTRAKGEKPKIVKREIDKWVQKLNPQDPRYRIINSVIWLTESDLTNITLLKELLNSTTIMPEQPQQNNLDIKKN